MGKTISKINPERKRQRFSKEFKVEAVRLLELGKKPATNLAMELGIARNQLYKWQEQLGKKGPEQAFREHGVRSCIHAFLQLFVIPRPFSRRC